VGRGQTNNSKKSRHRWWRWIILTLWQDFNECLQMIKDNEDQDGEQIADDS